MKNQKKSSTKSKTISFFELENNLVKICQISSQNTELIEARELCILLTKEQDEVTKTNIGKLVNGENIIYSDRHHIRTPRNGINAYLTKNLDKQVIEWLKSTFNLAFVDATKNYEYIDYTKLVSACYCNFDNEVHLPSVIEDKEIVANFDPENEAYYQELEALRVQIEDEDIEKLPW